MICPNCAQRDQETPEGYCRPCQRNPDNPVVFMTRAEDNRRRQRARQRAYRRLAALHEKEFRALLREEQEVAGIRRARSS